MSLIDETRPILFVLVVISVLITNCLCPFPHPPPQDLELFKGKDFGLPHFGTLNPHLSPRTGPEGLRKKSVEMKNSPPNNPSSGWDW